MRTQRVDVTKYFSTSNISRLKHLTFVQRGSLAWFLLPLQLPGTDIREVETRTSLSRNSALILKLKLDLKFELLKTTKLLRQHDVTSCWIRTHLLLGHQGNFFRERRADGWHSSRNQLRKATSKSILWTLVDFYVT